ncbi:MAG: LacI family DNA-binding transcriptional regulator [Nocardioides sp.]
MTEPSKGQTKGPRPATLEEVARLAGVSRATASRVLRGATNVSPEAVEAVERAAAEINYTPNLAARSLVTGRSDSIAFLVNETEERLFTEPFFLAMLRSCQAAVTDSGLQLNFAIASTAEQRDRFLAYASGGHVDGVLLLSVHGDDDLQVRLEKAGVPTVLSGRPYSGAPVFFVDADNVGGGRLATQHLIANGRRTIATVTGSLDLTAGQDRLAGYRAAIEEAGLPVAEDLIEPGGFATSEGYEAATRLLARRPDVDAIVTGSDLAAIGVIRAVLHAGRRVPEDVAVVGFDDFREAAENDPPLTTIRQPMEDLGATMAAVLLGRLDGSETEPRGVMLPVELVVRTSG